ncbi:MAG: hypothetical protein QOE02_4922, partial [Rhodospirillaceae bacterium]|nr:hypothetical protein [Rhodospirillaceae bacterium]
VILLALGHDQRLERTPAKPVEAQSRQSKGQQS